jgi:hypothetical protein
MKKEIAITFSHVAHDSTLPFEKRNELSKAIYDILEPIKDDVISQKGTVEVIESKLGNFSFRSACKNEALRDKMNDLISHAMPKKPDA